jgi:hypothetical protein
VSGVTLWTARTRSAGTHVEKVDFFEQFLFMMFQLTHGWRGGDEEGDGDGDGEDEDEDVDARSFSNRTLCLFLPEITKSREVEPG